MRNVPTLNITTTIITITAAVGTIIMVGTTKRFSHQPF
jgi:hypothetical protein